MRLFNILLGAAWLFSGVCTCAFAVENETKAPAGLSVTSYPEKSRIFVDGKARGSAGLSIYDLPPGRHWVRAEAPHFKSEDRFVTLEEGVTKRIDFELEKETGLLLVTSDPAGAEVVDVDMNRAHLGITPFLATNLATGRDYTLEFTKTGFGARRVRVRLASREPVAVHEILRNDSGRIRCVTVPEGAKVFVNGIDRGLSPVELSLPMGKVSIQCRKKGYRDVSHEITLSPGAAETVSLTMEGIPAEVSVVTTPSKADVFLDGSYKGRSPITIDHIPPGTHDIKVSCDGYASAAKSIKLDYGAKSTETFTLASVLGRIEIVSSPAGAKVFLDGKFKGRTKGSGAHSETFTISPVEAGEHTVTLRMPRHAESSAKVTVEPQKSAHVSRTLKKIFTKDFEITTASGSVYQGELMERTPAGFRLSISAGMERFFTNEEIRSFRAIPVADE